MNNILNILYVVIGGLVIFIILVPLGFAIKSRIVIPNLEPWYVVKTRPLPSTLPLPFYQYLKKISSHQIPAPITVVAWGRGRLIARKLPLFGAMWVPFAWALHMLPGKSFRWKTNVTWFNLSFLRGNDEYHQGHGKYTMNKTTLEGENMNLSQLTMMWLYTILFSPTTLVDNPQVTWQTSEDNSVMIEINPSQEAQTLAFILKFNPDNNELIQIETKRVTSKGKPEAFKLQFKEYQPINPDILQSSLMQAAWENDVYTKIEIKGVRYNVDIVEIF